MKTLLKEWLVAAPLTGALVVPALIGQWLTPRRRNIPEEWINKVIEWADLGWYTDPDYLSERLTLIGGRRK